MSDASVITPTPETTPAEAMGQTSLEHEGRVYTGTDTDADTTDAAFAETTVGRKAETAEQRAERAERPTRGQRRFSQLTSERDKARSEADALRAELEAAKAAKPAPVEAKAEPVKAEPVKAEPKAAKVDAPKRPTLEDFLDQPDPIKAFDQALDDYKESLIEQKIEARLSSRLEAERASRALTQTVADLVERGKAAYSDFEAVRQQSTVKFPEATLWAIVHDPNAEHIYYALASDDALAQQVSGITDKLELGRVLGRLGAVGTSAKPASPSPTVKSTAPRPFQPVSGASRTATKTIEELADAGDVDGYKAMRHAQMGIKAR